MMKKTIVFGSILIVLSLVLIGITQWIPLMINGVVAKNYAIENAEGNSIRLSVMSRVSIWLFLLMDFHQKSKIWFGLEIICSMPATA
jgi:hypothetical protein